MAERKVEVPSLPLILKCPIRGEEWPAETYKSSCDIYASKGKQTARTIHFICPGNHAFSLGEAVRSGMFTQAQKKLIVMQAQSHWETLMKQIRGET